MALSVEIDSNSGFCGGVIRAIRRAEDFLDSECSTLYSLGSIVPIFGRTYHIGIRCVRQSVGRLKIVAIESAQYPRVLIRIQLEQHLGNFAPEWK